MCIRDRYTPEPLGDYMSGSNHVLPTGGTAKFYSGLGVYNFIKYLTYSYYPKEVLADFKEDVETFAKSEGLTAHANSISVRFDEMCIRDRWNTVRSSLNELLMQ